MRAFEIHIYQNGKWKTDSSFDDRGLAIHEARRIDAGGRYLGVRVVEETFEEGTQQVSSRPIFRGSRLDPVDSDRMERTDAVREEATAQRRERGKPRERAVSARNKKSNPTRIVMLLMLLAACGISALIGLQYL